MKRILLALLLPAVMISPATRALPTDHGPEMHDIPHIAHPHPDHAPRDLSSLDVPSQGQVIVVQPAAVDRAPPGSPAAPETMDYAPATAVRHRQVRNSTAAHNIRQSGGVIDNANSMLQDLGLYSGGR